MNRLIIPRPARSRAGAVSDSDADRAAGRLVKYIPAEIISGYMLLSGIATAASQTSNLRMAAAWGLFWLGFVLTPLYLWKVGKPTGVQWWHLPISTISFALWAYALGGPFETSKLLGYGYEKWFAAFLAGAFSWAIALIWSPEDKR
jgi:hypothetical protein